MYIIYHVGISFVLKGHTTQHIIKLLDGKQI